MGWILFAMATALAAPPQHSPEAQRAAAGQWHEASARAATASLTGLEGCAQVLGEPETEKAFHDALGRTPANTRCVDLKGRVALLNPSVSTSAYGPELVPWTAPAPAPAACETEGAPCVDGRGVLHVPGSALLAEVRGPTRIDRPTRKAFREAGIDEAHLRVRILVNARGEVVRAEVLDGPQEAHALALATVESWSFTPVVADGRPRDVRTDLEMTFRLR